MVKEYFRIARHFNAVLVKKRQCKPIRIWLPSGYLNALGARARHPVRAECAVNTETAPAYTVFHRHVLKTDIEIGKHIVAEILSCQIAHFVADSKHGSGAVIRKFRFKSIHSQFFRALQCAGVF